MRFDEILSNDDILDALYDMRFDECTPIQEKSMPYVLEGRDLLGIAQTGTGKTAAYLLPIIQRLIDENFPQDNVNCVIMVPTRELAVQIDHQLQGFSYYLPVSGLAIYGGTDGDTYNTQRQGLKKGADIVIATPGRLLSHISMGHVDLSKVSFFVLDEADRMLDMGFFDDIMQIVGRLPKKRQTLLFSATMPPKIRELTRQILTDPAEIRLAVSKPADKIMQQAAICYETQKQPLLKKIFKETPPERVLVFCSSKEKVKELAKELKSSNINVAQMHSDLDQKVREDVMLAFKAGKTKVIVATDIIARGIDIDNIEMVINYDVPHEPEDYVHRVGRTARADRDGRAITLVNEKDCRKFKSIEKFLGKEIEKITLDESFGPTPDYNAKCSPAKKRRHWKPRRQGMRKNDKSASKRHKDSV